MGIRQAVYTWAGCRSCLFNMSKKKPIKILIDQYGYGLGKFEGIYITGIRRSLNEGPVFEVIITA